MAKPLYLIALVPDEELRDRVRNLKLEMDERFNSSHALKAPAHITLQMPFRRDEAIESILIDELEGFSSEQVEFDVNINGFGSFPPRVLFLEISNHKPIEDFHAKLNVHLKTRLNFMQKELNNEIHPHMTIATRDLSKKMFRKAWPEFKNRPFEASFRADRLHLLKHNGKQWEFFQDFRFTSDN